MLKEKLPRLTRDQTSRQISKLYPVEVVETDGSKIKIHYVGYADKYDEGREVEDVEAIDTDAVEDERCEEAECYTPFDPHRELAFRIKAALDSEHRKGVDVRIDIPFHKLLFNGGLKQK